MSRGMQRRRVDFPAPFAPIRATMLPGAMFSVMPENTGLPGVKDFASPEMAIAAEERASAAAVIELYATFTYSPRNLENSGTPMVAYMRRTMS